MMATLKKRLRDTYDDEIAPALMKEFGLTNKMQVPKLTKIVVNAGLGEAITNPKAIEAAVADISTITGQRPVVTKAKKSIATYKLREGMPIGAMVTLRRERMWSFLERLVNVALPRVRDFRGIASEFDGKGNLSIGIREQIIFPEIDYDKVDKIRGFNVSFVTTAPNDEQGKALLKQLGMPFRK
jgi:large subunit ribosomal protein L5